MRYPRLASGIRCCARAPYVARSIITALITVGSIALLTPRQESSTISASVAGSETASHSPYPDDTNTLHGPATIGLRQMPPVVTIDDVSVTEGDTGATVEAVFTLTLSETSLEPITVDFNTADATAAAGADYVAQISTVTFAPGDLAKQITVTVNGDDIVESDEILSVELTNPVNVTLADGLGAGTILNDDTAGYNVDPPALTVTEGQSGQYTITLQSQPEDVVTVELSVDLPGQCSITPTVTLDASNWDTASDNVTVTALDDLVAEVSHPDCVISHLVTTNDPAYKALAGPEDYPVALNDNDVAGVAVDPNRVELPDQAVSETYTLTLATLPSRLPLSPSRALEHHSAIAWSGPVSG